MNRYANERTTRHDPRAMERPSDIQSDGGPWILRFEGFDPEAEGRREALCTLGNGYWGTRGAAPEADSDSVHYPGTYLAGVYNRVITTIGNRSVEDEHMVNAPNWLPLRFRMADGEWYRPRGPELLHHVQELDLRRATLTRTIRWRDHAGRTTRVTSCRFLSQAEPHVAVLTTTVEAEDWSGPMIFQSALDGRVANRNAASDRMLTGVHLIPRGTAEINGETVLLEVETNQSGIHVAMAARTRVLRGDVVVNPVRRHLFDHAGWVAHEFAVDIEPGRPVTVEKCVAVATSRDRAIASPARAVAVWLARLADRADLLAAHERQWRILWEEFAVDVRASSPESLALNVNTFHVLQTLAEANLDLDAGIPARGLHGEGYRGHVFWDEMFVYPMLTLRRPDLSRAMLGYRYRRLNEARARARSAGHAGAMFPWQSGIDGSEVTPTELYNPHSLRWQPDFSHRQQHVGLAIAYSVWWYYQCTADADFMIHQGAEMLIDVARYFANLTTYDETTDRYDIDGAMGPDEFHDGYPDRPGRGMRNNAYTNVMTAWVLRRAIETVSLLEARSSDPLWNRLELRPDEIDLWDRISHRLRVPFHADGVISQFEGYEDLPEFDWEGYRSQHDSFYGLGMVLAAQGDSTNNYRISKQADVLMLLYLFSAEELRALLEEMGYALPPEAIVRTVDFYASRSTHGSTLSNVVHSWVEARSDRERSWRFLQRALQSDMDDIQGGTTQEGIHLGAMAGSVDMVVRCYTGLEIREDILWLHPVLPAELEQVGFSVSYREQRIRLVVTSSSLHIDVEAGGGAPIRLVVEGEQHMLAPGEARDFVIRPG